MKKINKVTLGGALLFVFSPSFAGDAVYDKYRILLGRLGDKAAVSAFVNDNNYLSDRLRKKWLGHLYRGKDYHGYVANYVPTRRASTRCQYLYALYQTGQKDLALKKVSPLWLSGHKQPKSCAPLFSLWQKSDFYSKTLLWKRFSLAVDARQYGLARSLKTYMTPEDKTIANKWIRISHAPHKLRTYAFPPHSQNAAIHAHALRKWVKRDSSSAIKHWEKVKDIHAFNHEQKQGIYRTIALYAAMRNKPHAETWFKKLDQSITPKMHLEWRVRSALKKRDWARVNRVIAQLPAKLKDKSCWQYWYARSFEALGQNQKAQKIYKTLSKKRHYYGFLASYRGKLPPNMQHDQYEDNDALLRQYKKQIAYINELYKNKQTHKAHLLSYELANDLSNEERYQLAREYADWKWHAKALAMANLSEHKDDLRLRFPLAHEALIDKYAKQYNIEKPFIFAIIRQESTFRTHAKSSANAMGLMQVIPSTARRVSRRNKIKLGALKNMYKPKVNMQVGTAYLKILSKRFNNHPVLMAAAYNAGPSQVNYWLRKHASKSPDIWIETLPWGETRNYLKNVLSFYAVYQYRLNQAPSIKPFMKEIGS
jgi:soluble lytic murein transglycosylase